MSSEIYQISGDWAVQILLVAREGIRFRLIRLRAPTEAPEAPSSVRVSVEAVSPPPYRQGGPEVPAGPISPRAVQTLPELDQPLPNKSVLNQVITVYREATVGSGLDRVEPGEPTSFLAEFSPQEEGRWRDADFYGEYEVLWQRMLEPDVWVAIRFRPLDSAGGVWLVAQVVDRWLSEVRKEQADTAGEVTKPPETPPETAPEMPPGMPPYIRAAGPEREWADQLLQFAVRNGWDFDDAARLNVETILFFEKQVRAGASVLLRAPRGIRRLRRGQGMRRVRFEFRNQGSSPQAKNGSLNTWRWWE